MIVPMKRLTLIAHKDDERKIVEALQALSSVEIIQQSDVTYNSDSLDKAQENVLKLNSALEILKPYSKKSGLLTPPEEVTLSGIDNKVLTETAESEEITATERSISDISSEIERNTSTVEALRPWSGMTAPIENLSCSQRVRYFCGSVAKADVETLTSSCPNAEVEIVGETEECDYVIVACLASDEREVQVFLKSLAWADFSFPKVEGTPSEVIAGLEKQNAELSKKKDELLKTLADKGSKVGELREACDAASIRRDREQALNELPLTEYTFRLEGWIRSDKLEETEKAVASVTDAYSFSVRDPEEGEVPPSVLKNSNLVTPFEGVNNLYSLPDPVSGIDGTPYMTPFYIFLFGMMLSDAGYGLVLMIGAWLFNRIAKPRGMVGDIAKVLVWGGLSTIVWGVLVGTFFGVDFDVIFGTNNVFPLFMDPMSQPIPYLLFCFGLGVIHIMFGIILKIKMSFDAGDWQTAVFDNISWILIILGLIVYACSSVAAVLPAVFGTVGLVMAAVGAVMILLFKGRANKNVVMRAASGLGELYQVTSYLSDILSYARLFALGIATGVIAEVFNELCGMLMGSGNIVLAILGTIIAVILLVFLHLFNIAINTLGTFVHCARLQYVEFYGKFFEAGGRSFKPLTYRTKHVRITDEN